MKKSKDVDRAMREVVKLGKKGSCFKVNKTKVCFARATDRDIEFLKELSDEELLRRYKEKCVMQKFGTSIRDLQILDLMEMEMYRRRMHGSEKVVFT